MFNRNSLKRPDVVIISSLSLLTIIYGLHLKSIYKCKLVFEIRDIYPLTLTEELGVSKWHPITLFLGVIEKIGYKKSDLIVGTMPNLKAHVKEIIKEDKEVFFSPIGINAIWSNALLSKISIDHLFPKEEKFIVGYAGSIGISNALDSFIEAINKMSEYEDIFFILVGDGDLKETYIDKVVGMSNVIFGPKIPQVEVPSFLNKCDLLYLSAKNSKIWDYGQSMNKIIDYMMAGKPVVASYSGYPSMLNEADSGLFIPSNDVEAIIEAVLSYKNMSSNERELYGSRGKNWVKVNHSYVNISREYVNKIGDMLKL
jgi:glycosyltransferase involved in cell wall biosynthesis